MLKIKKINILVLGKGSVKLNNTTIQAENESKTNCLVPEKNFVFSVHYSGDNSYLYINGVQQYKFKTKYSEIKADKLCLGNTDDYPGDIDTFRGYIYHFSADYQPATTDKIQKIHKYLVEKNNIV